MSNFKNICQTVVKRHQHLLCYYLHTNELFSRELIVGPFKSPSLLSEECSEVITHLQSCSLITHPSFIKCNGITIKPNVYILLSYDVFDPVFCKVIDILSTDAGVFVVYHEYLTHYNDYHYHSYIIKPTCKSLCVCKINYFPFFLVFHPRRSFDRNESYLYISLDSH